MSDDTASHIETTDVLTGPASVDEMVQAAADRHANPYQLQTTKLGASKISKYLQCPRQFRYQYIDRLPAPYNPKATAGTCVHDTVNMIHECKLTIKDLDTAIAYNERLWEELRARTTDPDDPEMAKVMLEVQKVHLPWYFSYIEDKQTIAHEERWEVSIEKWLATGTIDWVYSASGLTVVSDLKTGARAPSEADLLTDIQLSMYSYAWRELAGRPEDRMEIIQLRQTSKGKDRIMPASRTQRHLDAFRNEIFIPVAEAINGGHFPCNPSSRYGCNYCDYTTTCPIGRGD